MWTLVVVLLYLPGDMVFTRHAMTFASRLDCEYALSFVPVERRLGDWEISYSACEPRTAV